MPSSTNHHHPNADHRYSTFNKEQRMILTLSKGNNNCHHHDSHHFHRSSSNLDEAPFEIINSRGSSDLMATQDLISSLHQNNKQDDSTASSSLINPELRPYHPDDIHPSVGMNSSHEAFPSYTTHDDGSHIAMEHPPNEVDCSNHGRSPTFSLPFSDHYYNSQQYTAVVKPPVALSSSLNRIGDLHHQLHRDIVIGEAIGDKKQHFHQHDDFDSNNEDSDKHPSPPDDDSASRWVRNTFFHLTADHSSCESTSSIQRDPTTMMMTTNTIDHYNHGQGFSSSTSHSPSHLHTVGSGSDLAPPSWIIRQKEQQQQYESASRTNVHGGQHDFFDTSRTNSSRQSGLLPIGSGRHHRLESNVTTLSDTQDNHIGGTNSRTQLYPSILPVGPTSTLETFETPAYDRIPTDGILQFFLQDLQARENQASSTCNSDNEDTMNIGEKAQDVLLHYCQDVLRNQKEQGSHNNSNNSQMRTTATSNRSVHHHHTTDYNNGSHFAKMDDVSQSQTVSWESLHGHSNPTSSSSSQLDPQQREHQHQQHHHSTTTSSSATIRGGVPQLPLYPSTSTMTPRTFPNQLPSTQPQPPPPPSIQSTSSLHLHNSSRESFHDLEQQHDDLQFAPPPPPPPSQHQDTNVSHLPQKSSSSLLSYILQTPSPTAFDTHHQENLSNNTTTTPMPDSPPIQHSTTTTPFIIPSTWINTHTHTTNHHVSGDTTVNEQMLSTTPSITFGEITTFPPKCLDEQPHHHDCSNSSSNDDNDKKDLTISGMNGSSSSSSTLTLIYQRGDVQLYKSNRTSSVVPGDEAVHNGGGSTPTTTRKSHQTARSDSQLENDQVNTKTDDVSDTDDGPLIESPYDDDSKMTHSIHNSIHNNTNIDNNSDDVNSRPKGVKSSGSLLHPNHCKPCAFFWTKGCINATSCQFCHEWHMPKKKKPMKDQKNLMIISRPDGKIEFLRCTINEALGRS